MKRRSAANAGDHPPHLYCRIRYLKSDIKTNDIVRFFDIIHMKQFISNGRAAQTIGIRYDRLWKKLSEEHMSKGKLKDSAGISYNIIAKMGKNEPVSMESIEKICGALNCNVENIIEFVPNDAPSKQVKQMSQ